MQGAGRAHFSMNTKLSEANLNFRLALFSIYPGGAQCGAQWFEAVLNRRTEFIHIDIDIDINLFPMSSGVRE